MTQGRPRGLDAGRARELLSEARHASSVAARVERLSALLLGSPYEARGLIGSADTREVLTGSLERFDCVTYVETVLALARATRASGLAGWLRRIRYENGQVAWSRRNHYMTGWIRANARAGFVRPLPAGPHSRQKDRLLDAVPGLPPRRARFSCMPKRLLKSPRTDLRTGDLLFFVSTRKDLDVFHCGILVAGAGGWRMRHAARSLGRVVEGDLGEFLGQNRMAGVLVARPAPGSGARQS